MIAVNERLTPEPPRPAGRASEGEDPPPRGAVARAGTTRRKPQASGRGRGVRKRGRTLKAWLAEEENELHTHTPCPLNS
eukprot:scaffold124161_cov32-Tisochrysis_lutea.AAC.1